jgi:hypothetical protein
MQRGKNVIRNRLKNKVENIIFCPLSKLQVHGPSSSMDH